MNLDYQKDYWLNFANTANINDLAKDLNGSWDAETQSYGNYSKIDDEALSFLQRGEMKNVLDFVVGMGRNAKYLSSLFENVYGFDTPPMIKNLSEARNSPEKLFSSWENAESRQYSLVFEATVMQHMPPQEVVHRLYSISYISPYLFSITRSYNDYLRDFQNAKRGVNMASLVASLDAFEPVYSSISLEEAKQKMDETHYSVLYKSKNFQ